MRRHAAVKSLPDPRSDQAVMAWLTAIPRDERSFVDVRILYGAHFGRRRPLSDEALWRAWTILPIVLGSEHGSPDRAKFVSARAAKPALHWRGDMRLLSKSTLHRWLALYAAGGLNALARKPPNNAGQPRTQISRQWDRAMRAIGATEPQLAKIKRAVREKLRELWNDGRPSRNDVRRLALPFVIELTKAAGLAKPDDEMTALCDVPRHLADGERPPALRRRSVASPLSRAPNSEPAVQLTLTPGIITPQAAPAIDPDAEWCLLVLRPGAQPGGGGIPAAFGKWLGRQFKVSSVHFITAETARQVTGTLRQPKPANTGGPAV